MRPPAPRALRLRVATGIRGLAALAATLLGPAGVQAEGSSFRTPLKPGATALQFAGVLDGGGLDLGLKHHFTAGTALRVQFGFEVGDRDDHIDTASFVSDSLVRVTAFDVGTDRLTFRLGTQLVLHPGSPERVSLFFAVGPFVSFDQFESKRSEIRPTSTEFSSAEFENWSLGLASRVGFEWFFQSRLSLGAEAGLEGFYRWEEELRRNEFESTTFRTASRVRIEGDVVEISTGRSSVALAYYF